jgi:hypothetical protein
MNQTLACGFVLLLVSPVVAAENALFNELTTTGVRMSSAAALVLPPPTMADNLSAAEQQQRITQIAEGKHSADSLTRNSVVAPFVLKIDTIPPASEQANAACRIDLWFVVHGALERISDDQFLRQQVESETNSKTDSSSPQLVALSASDLASRHIEPIADQRFFAGNLVLFDRVRVNLALQGLQTRTPQSVLVAMAIDPRFDHDNQYPNGWQKLTRDNAGKLQVGALQPYQAAGGYVKATRLSEPSGAIFIEYHMAFEEPRTWFDGANLLRSKLPLVCQDGVRSFRRRVAGP